MACLIWHLLRESVRGSPDKEALVHQAERLNYSEVARRTNGLAVGLRTAGLGRGDRMGIYLEASVPQVISIFGISRAEAVYVAINSVLHAEHVMHIARECGMKGLITPAAKLPSLVDVLPQIPSLEFLVVVGPGEVTAKLPVHHYEEFCALALPADWRESSIEKDLAAILYTSGSTGKPKAVIFIHAISFTGIPLSSPLF